MTRLLGCTALAALFATTAWAQSGDDGTGARVGAFIISPTITVTDSLDSNVFLDETNETETFRVLVAPRLEIASDWNRHALSLETGAQFGFYTHDSDDDFIDYDIALSGELDITRGARISTTVGYFHSHEARGSDDVPGFIAEPVEFDGFTAELQGDVAFNFLRFTPFANAQFLDFEDAPVIGGGLDNQDDRDRTEMEAGLEVSYAVRRGYEAFVRGSYLTTEYDAPVDDQGVDRDSDGWRVLTGIRIDLTRLLEGSVGVGYVERDFQDPALADASGFALDAGLVWSASPRTNVFLNANRNVRETTITGASSLTDSGVELGATYSLLRSLTLAGSLSYTNLDFEGVQRSDDIYGMRLGADWDVSRHVVISPSYTLAVRESDDNTVNDYVDHRLSISGQYKF